MGSGVCCFTRRGLVRMLAAGAVFGVLRGALEGAAPLSWHEAVHFENTSSRRYRADAQVIILSIPLLHRSGVGGGSVAWNEAAEAGRGTLRLLEFLGFSEPKRAAGLNRLGFIRELVRISAGQLTEALYFGLMTYSPEESAEQARKALHPPSGEAAYTAIEGRVAAGGITTAGTHFMAPATLSADRLSELETRARQALAGAVVKPAEFDARGRTPSTFLETLAELLPSSRGEGSYVYDGRLYHLWLRRTADAKATQYFRGRHMAVANVIRVSGKLRRESGGKEWEFRLWVEEGAARPLPLRIEYQAKSYLRLTFEAES